MGLQVVRETQEQAQALAVPGAVQADMLEASALVPARPRRIDDPRTVARLRLRIDGLTGLDAADLAGAGQSSDGATDRGPGRARPHAGPGPGRPRAVPGRRGVPGERRPRDPRRGGEGGGRATDAAAAGRAARPPRPRDRREAADREPALRARGAQDPRRRLQRAHGALRRDGPLARPAGAHRRRARVPARRLLLPRLGRGLDRRGARPRPLAPRRPHAQPVPGRRHARAPGARRPRPPGGDRRPDRTARSSTSSTSSCAPAPSPSSSAATPPTCSRSTCRCRVATRGGCWSQPPRRSQVILVESLVKTFGSFRAVDGVSLDVKPRRDPRLPGAERRRQDHHDPHDRGPAQAHRGPRHDRRPRPRPRAGGRQAGARLHSRPPVPLREADRGRVPALPRRALRARGRAGRGARARAARRCSSSPPGQTSWSRASRTA